MKIDDNFTNVNVKQTATLNNVKILNTFRFENLINVPIITNTGYYLSEEKDRRLIDDGYELYLSEDGQMATLNKIKNGEIIDVVASDTIRTRHISNFSKSEHVVFFRNINKSTYSYQNESTNIIILYYVEQSVLKRIKMYKKQIKNVVFDSNLELTV